MESKKAIIEALNHSDIFGNLADEQIKEVLDTCVVIKCQHGDIIVKEGDKDRALFVILSGRVDVVRNNPETNHEFVMTTMDTGDEFGELSLLMEEERTATIRANGEVQLLKMTLEVLETFRNSEDKTIYNYLMYTLAHELGKKLIDTDVMAVQQLEDELEYAKMQNAMAEFIVFITGIMTIFSFVLTIISYAAEDAAFVDLFSNVATAVALIGFITLIIRSPYTLEDFGITIPDQIVKHIVYALGWSAILIVFTLLAKWILVLTVPAYKDFPMFFLPGQEYPGFEYSVSKLTLTLALGYVVLALIQELMTRGVIQGILTRFFEKWAHKHTAAILLSNGMFAVAHLHISPGFAIVTFFAGCLWGIQYVYQPKSFLGVWLSHTIVGLFGLRILGLVPMIQAVGL